MAADKKTPAPASQSQVPEKRSSDQDVTDFLEKMKLAARPDTDGNRGRLVFAMDATMSRQPTWDMALKLQADMFIEVKAIGGLDVQLVYFRS